MATAWVPPSDVCLVEVRPSAYGDGVFTRAPAPRGAVLFVFAGPVFDRAAYEAYPDKAHCVQIGAETYLGPSGYFDDLINHSCAPNAFIRITRAAPLRADIVAVRDLDEGEEVTFDYSCTMLHDPWCLEGCACGAPACRGTIRGFDELSAAQRLTLLATGTVPYYCADLFDATTGEPLPDKTADKAAPEPASPDLPPVAAAACAGPPALAPEPRELAHSPAST